MLNVSKLDECAVRVKPERVGGSWHCNVAVDHLGQSDAMLFNLSCRLSVTWDLGSAWLLAGVAVMLCVMVLLSV